uniref:CCHC-type domain-containing protein n=1 Tax=Eptatretus burgeri TaxID=7764 RepID=A0A8C4Q241_EPTBU
MAAACSQQSAAFEHLSRKHGIACSPPEGVTVEAIVMVIGNIIGFEKVRAASCMNKRVIIFVSDEAFVAPIVEQGLALDSGTFVMAYPLDCCVQRVVISNLPPFLKNDLIPSAMQRYGDCVSPLIMLPVGFNDKRESHVMSFRRQVFMVLKKEYASLNLVMKFTSNGHNYQLYVSTNTLNCFGCGAIGHMKQFCPISQKQPPLNAPSNDFQTNTITFTQNDHPPPNVTHSVGNDTFHSMTDTARKVSASNVTDCAHNDPLPNVTGGGGGGGGG